MHLVVARLAEHGGFEMLTSEKEMVRLGAGGGGGEMKSLAPDAIERSLAALARMKEVAGSFGDVEIAPDAGTVLRGDTEVQLLKRHWLIHHGSGRRAEVEGEGVVGQQPVIRPGGAHSYNSFCVLEAMTGTMEGTYLMQRANGSRFRAQIPLFHLRARAN